MTYELINICNTIASKLATKYDEYAVMIYEINNVMSKITNSQIALNLSRNLYVIDLYLVRRKKIFTMELSTSDLSQVLRLSDDILNYVGLIKESELYSPLPEIKPVKPLSNILDRNVVNYLNDPRQVCELLINSAINEGAERVEGTLSLSITSKALVSSNGFEGFEGGSEVMAYLRVFKDGSSGQWAYGGRSADLRSLEEVGRKAAHYALLGRKSASITPGKYDVVLSPLVVGNLFELITMMASAFYVLSGFSMFMGVKQGDRVASELVTLIDSPRDVELPGSTAFDDEGIETYDKEVISKGVLKTLLHNSKTASKLGAMSTGNAGWIVPRAWNIVIGTGDSSEDEMIREVKNGLLISNNWYTRFQNYIEGTFSTVSRDATLLIRNGEIVGNVGRIRVADSLRRLLSNVRLISKEYYLIKWWEVTVPTKAPYILVNDVNITKPFE